MYIRYIYGCICIYKMLHTTYVYFHICKYMYIYIYTENVTLRSRHRRTPMFFELWVLWGDAGFFTVLWDLDVIWYVSEGPISSTL